ncbi:MAG: caspase family protein [Hyphomicrobiaceae bacterium]
MRLGSLTFLAVVFVHSAIGSASAAKKVALVIGNAAYVHAGPLKNPRNDAEAMAAALGRLGFQIVKGIDLTKAGLIDKMREFGRALKDTDVGVFYYAGHGLQVHGRNYLVPVDAKLDDEGDLPFEAVELMLPIQQMEREAKTGVVFLDACRDNPLARNLARSMATRSGGSRSNAVGQGLASVEAGTGTLIAFSTQPGNVALDGQGLHSPFTEALLQHIETAGTPVSSLLIAVRRQVKAATGNRQVPWEHSSLTDEVVFNPGSLPPSDGSQTELERLRAETAAARARAETERLRAEAVRAKAEEERLRAQAEAATERLRAEERQRLKDQAERERLAALPELPPPASCTGPGPAPASAPLGFNAYANPSFPCSTYSRTPLHARSRIPQSEILCSDTAAADADREMGDAFYTLLRSLPASQHANLKGQQRAWRVERDHRCCATWNDLRSPARVAAIAQCLQAVTRERTEALRRMR